MQMEGDQHSCQDKIKSQEWEVFIVGLYNMDHLDNENQTTFQNENKKL